MTMSPSRTIQLSREEATRRWSASTSMLKMRLGRVGCGRGRGPPGSCCGCPSGGRQLSRWDTCLRAGLTRLFVAVGRRRPDDYKERDKRRGKPCAASEITASPSPRARLTSGRGEVEAQAVGALRAVRQDRSSNPERAMNYLNRARQCPTAFSRGKIIPAGTLIHDPRSTKRGMR